MLAKLLYLLVVIAMAERYARKVTTGLVGQMAEVAGFDQAHGNAIDAVSDVFLRFIEEIAKTSKEFAELQGRTDVNVLDVVCYVTPTSPSPCPDQASAPSPGGGTKKIHAYYFSFFIAEWDLL